MRRLVVVAALAAAWAACAPAARAASFACAKAASAAEKAICADPALSRLDEQAAKAWRDAADAMGLDLSERDGPAAVFRDAQRAWLRDRDRCGGDVSCLRREHERRLAVLAFKPDPKNLGPLDRFVGRYDGERQPASGAMVMKTEAGGVLVSLDAVEPSAARWTCQASGQGYLDGRGDLQVEMQGGDVLTFKPTRNGVQVVGGEGVAETLSRDCGAGGALAMHYRRR